MTTSDLGKKLKEMYNSLNENKAAMILLFGILYATEIKKNTTDSSLNSVVKDIIDHSGIPKSYCTEIKKAVSLSVHVNPTAASKKRFL